MMQLSRHGNASTTTEIYMLRYDIECWVVSHRFDRYGTYLMRDDHDLNRAASGGGRVPALHRKRVRRKFTESCNVVVWSIDDDVRSRRDCLSLCPIHQSRINMQK